MRTAPLTLGRAIGEGVHENNHHRFYTVKIQGVYSTAAVTVKKADLSPEGLRFESTSCEVTTEVR